MTEPFIHYQFVSWQKEQHYTHVEKFQEGLASFVYSSSNIFKCLLTLWHDVAIFTTP